MSYHCDTNHHKLEDKIISTSSLGHFPFESGSLKFLEDVSKSMAHVQPNSDINGATTVQKLEAHSGHSASLNVTSKTNREVVAVVSTRREKPALTVQLLTLFSDKDPLLRVSPSSSPAPVVKRIMIHREKTGTDWQSVFNVVKYGKEKQTSMVIEKRVVA